jgi:hypothetical protein
MRQVEQDFSENAYYSQNLTHMTSNVGESHKILFYINKKALMTRRIKPAIRVMGGSSCGTK